MMLPINGGRHHIRGFFLSEIFILHVDSAHRNRHASRAETLIPGGLRDYLEKMELCFCGR